MGVSISKDCKKEVWRNGRNWKNEKTKIVKTEEHYVKLGQIDYKIEQIVQLCLNLDKID